MNRQNYKRDNEMKSFQNSVCIIQSAYTADKDFPKLSKTGSPVKEKVTSLL